jgi:hypothetical protein
MSEKEDFNRAEKMNIKTNDRALNIQLECRRWIGSQSVGFIPRGSVEILKK